MIDEYPVSIAEYMETMDSPSLCGLQCCRISSAVSAILEQDVYQIATNNNKPGQYWIILISYRSVWVELSLCQRSTFEPRAAGSDWNKNKYLNKTKYLLRVIFTDICKWSKIQNTHGHGGKYPNCS